MAEPTTSYPLLQRNVTELAKSFSVSGTDTEQSVLAELTAAPDGTGAEQSVLAESRGADGTDDVRPSLVEPVAPDGTGAEQSVDWWSLAQLTEPAPSNRWIGGVLRSCWRNRRRAVAG